VSPVPTDSRRPPTERCPHMHLPPLSSSCVGYHRSQVHLLLLAAFPHSTAAIPTPLCTEGRWQVAAPLAPSLPRDWPRPHVKPCHRDVPPKHRSRIRCGPHRRVLPPVVLLSGCHLLKNPSVALVLPGPRTGRSQTRTTSLPSCFPTRVAPPCTDLLVSFQSSPPPQIASSPRLDPPRTVSPPPHHRPSLESAGRHHQCAMAAPPLLRPWALRPRLAGPCCQARLDVEVGWPKVHSELCFYPVNYLTQIQVSSNISKFG
jgi:hypothetical protein